MSDIEFMKLCR